MRIKIAIDVEVNLKNLFNRFGIIFCMLLVPFLAAAIFDDIPSAGGLITRVCFCLIFYFIILRQKCIDYFHPFLYIENRFKFSTAGPLIAGLATLVTVVSELVTLFEAECDMDFDFFLVWVGFVLISSLICYTYFFHKIDVYHHCILARKQAHKHHYLVRPIRFCRADYFSPYYKDYDFYFVSATSLGVEIDEIKHHDALCYIGNRHPHGVDLDDHAKQRAEQPNKIIRAYEVKRLYVTLDGRDYVVHASQNFKAVKLRFPSHETAWVLVKAGRHFERLEDMVAESKAA